MDLRVLLIAQEDKAREKYLEVLGKCGVHVFTSASFQDLSEEIYGQSFHGIFLDLPTKIKSLKQNKNYVYGLVESFPVSHLKINDETGEISCFHYSQKSGGTMLDFINNECRNSIPRMIRSDARKEIHLNVMLYKTENATQPEFSVTMDISKGGCFIFSAQEWEEGNEVWIHINEFKDKALISGQIRRAIRWGQSMRIPGIGVEFRKISASQKEALLNLYAAIK
ncbi:MAG: PilZ domain-containing protein [Deltaproteobacteria bacterium]|nr:PilZ domain-containing protein [Deltaproteobacteria bacterium]